jgi:hypothetical protein
LTVKERDGQRKTKRGSNVLSQLEDLKPILDRDARRFYLILRIESIE